MREITKNKLYEMLDMMQEAMAYHGQPEEMFNLLVDCQNAALQIGEVIEKATSPEHSCIKYLEEYTECIYQAANDMRDSRQYSACMKQGKRLLLTVKNQICHRIEKTYEILFLPYKASMWDCFDSVYRAIKQEGKHQPVVMPIPYYSMDAKQKVIECTYEGGDLPEDIEITDYRTYDMEERRPDVIFIHNPYDNYNLVTRVPKQFFSSELIKVTEHLVYIPYLIRSENKLPEHYVVMPGILNAWRVYVQSEEIKKSYLSYYPFGDKIVAMGSPKIDMVLRANEEGKLMPEVWEKKLRNRKVFFYNTHIHNIMNHSDTLFEEYDYVVKEFAGRDDIALLWRPHPLTRETIKAYTPHLLEDYLDYLAKAEQQDNIVVDRSADLHRAMALSDAYIGDQSSLVQLYGVTGKPIFLTGAEKYNEKESMMRTFQHAMVDGTDLWVYDMIVPGLYRIDMVTWTGEYAAGFLTDELFALPDETKKMVKIQDKIIAVANHYLFVYDIAARTSKEIDLNGLSALEHRGTIGLFAYQDEVWIFPAYYEQSLLVYNIHDDSLRIDDRYDKIKSRYSPKDVKEVFYGRCVREGSRIWQVIRKTNQVAGIDIDSGEIFILELSGKLYIELACHDNTLWMLDDSGSTLIGYDLSAQKETRYSFESGKQAEPQKKEKRRPYDKIIADRDYVYILPTQTATVVILNKQTMSLDYVEIDPEQVNLPEDKPGRRKLFNGAIPHPKGILLFPNAPKGIIRLEGEDGGWHSELQSAKISRDSLHKWFQERKAQVYRSKDYPLPVYLDRVGRSEIPPVEQENRELAKFVQSMDADCGGRIWKDVLKALI